MRRSEKKVIDEAAASWYYIWAAQKSCFFDVEKGEQTVMRTKITLACMECKRRNYDTTKEKKNHPDRMEVKKYCPFCRKHTPHKETK